MTDETGNRREPLHRCVAAWIIGSFVGGLLLLWSFGWRRDAAALQRMDAYAETGKPLLIVVWHGKYFPLLPMARGRNVAIITNASFRGLIIGRVCRIFGYSPIHIPVKGKADKMAFIKRAIDSGTRMLAIVPDGPLGPYHIVKSGTVRLASEVGFRILPLSVASSPTMVMHKRWDKYEVPPPFARVALEIGEPFDIPADISGGVMEQLQEDVAEIMLAADAKAEATLERM